MRNRAIITPISGGGRDGGGGDLISYMRDRPKKIYFYKFNLPVIAEKTYDLNHMNPVS